MDSDEYFDEDEFQFDSGGEGPDDDDGADDGGLERENIFYETKELAFKDPTQALENLNTIIECEKDKLSFRALKWTIKIHFHQGLHQESLDKFSQLLGYTKKTIPISEAEKSINKLLNFLESSPFIEQFFDCTLNVYKEGKHDKAFVRTQLRLAHLLLSRKEFRKLETVINSLCSTCESASRDDPGKASQLIEIYSLAISMYTEKGDQKKLRDFYNQAKKIQNAVNAQRITSVIHECGGKMYMLQRDWMNAYADFFQAFKDYNDVGRSAKACQCLKYLVLANMLSKASINPFEDPLARAMQEQPEVQAILSLMTASQSRNLKAFETVIAENEQYIAGDAFLSPYVEELRHNIRTEVILHLIKPYTDVSLEFISEELEVSVDDVEGLIVGLILDGKITGSLDQVKAKLYLYTDNMGASHVQSLSRWTKQLEVLHTRIVADFRI
mmetsp:Transcript_23381/g.58470  ORF Transcript_23381/g.58470 Transcript_23381/m.58470 type:complete len:442 (+) Transcript_23381:166-1491(+)